MRSRRWFVPALLVLGFMVIAFLLGGPGDEGTPLDPDSTDELGTKALVTMLRELGADVQVRRDVPDSTHDIALLLQDQLDGTRRAELLRWVEAGGTLVVADTFSALTPELGGPPETPFGDASDTVVDRGACNMDELAGVNSIDSFGGFAYVVPEGAEHCFGANGTAFVVAQARGAGVVVALASPGVFVNDVLDTHDNAVLAADLLAPSDGTRVAFLEPPKAGTGTTSLFDLIAPRVKAFGKELAVAFVLYALWRARRLGKPVLEAQPVAIAGSELVTAVGGLMQQNKRPDVAADVLRADLRATLTDALGLPREIDDYALADLASRATGRPAETILSVLLALVTTDAELVTFAHEVDSIRHSIREEVPA